MPAPRNGTQVPFAGADSTIRSDAMRASLGAGDRVKVAEIRSQTPLRRIYINRKQVPVNGRLQIFAYGKMNLHSMTDDRVAWVVEARLPKASPEKSIFKISGYSQDFITSSRHLM